MSLLLQVKTLLQKDFLLEWRQKNAFYSLLLYVVGTVFITYLSLSFKVGKINSATWNAVFWIVLLFSAIHAVGKSFIQEDRTRDLYYRYVAAPEAIVLAKIAYNMVLMLLISFISFGLFYNVFDVLIKDLSLFLLIMALGAMGFASTLTLISGIAAKASNNGSLMTVLSIPILIPLLVVLVKASSYAIMGSERSHIYDELLTLSMINLMLVTASYLLFPYLWRS